MYVIKLYKLFINSWFHIISCPWQLFLFVRQPKVDPLLPSFATNIGVFIIYIFALCQIKQLHFKNDLKSCFDQLIGVRTHPAWIRISYISYWQLSIILICQIFPGNEDFIHFLFRWIFYVNYFKKIARKI